MVSEVWISTREAARIIGVTRNVVAQYCAGSTVRHLRCRRKSKGGQWFVSLIDTKRLHDELCADGFPGRDSLAGAMRQRATRSAGQEGGDAE